MAMKESKLAFRRSNRQVVFGLLPDYDGSSPRIPVEPTQILESDDDPEKITKEKYKEFCSYIEKELPHRVQIFYDFNKASSFYNHTILRWIENNLSGFWHYIIEKNNKGQNLFILNYSFEKEEDAVLFKTFWG